MIDPSRPWRPARALAHPAFLAALVVLAFNDHVLKGASILPALVTGKLSDVAGLLVAPLTLAWVARARTPRGWLAAHVAVGLGFSLLQVEPVAEALRGAVAVAGVSVGLWPDPTDLLALPALLVSHRIFGPSCRARVRPASRLIGVTALVLCSATSPLGDPAVRYPFPTAGILRTDVFIRHMGSQEIEISVRRVNDEHEVDCDELLGPPRAQRLVEDSHFGEEQRWALATGDAVPLWDRNGGAVDRGCYAVRLRARDREWLVAWRHDAPPQREIEIRLEPNDDVDRGAMVLAGEGDAPPRVPTGVRVHRWQ